ncbi:MAG: hypothetical protein ACREC0_12235 [Methylocella sp.]
MKNATTTRLRNDQRIELPEDDRFGIDPFAKALNRLERVPIKWFHLIGTPLVRKELGHAGHEKAEQLFRDML